jgi:hypothetical protein
VGEITPCSAAPGSSDAVRAYPGGLRDRQRHDGHGNGITRCAVLFLNYLHAQLNIPWERIVRAGGATLAETYANLGLGPASDGFVRFKAVIDSYFPPGKPSAG